MKKNSSDDDSSNEVAEMCFMALDNDEAHDFDPSHSYDELLDTFEELHENLKKAISKNQNLKRKIDILSKEITYLKEINVIFEKEKEMHLNEIEKLKQKSLDLNEILVKFTKGKKGLELLLTLKKCVFNKNGIGYKHTLSKSSTKMIL